MIHEFLDWLWFTHQEITPAGIIGSILAGFLLGRISVNRRIYK